MREILFRGKDELGQWLYGGFVRGEYPYVKSFKNSTTSYIVYTDDFCRYTPVVAETVGQYTGLTDKNGTKIFEGDIILVNGTKRVYVFFENGQFVINHFALNLLYDRSLESEVIGNIHDNPELLKTE